MDIEIIRQIDRWDRQIIRKKVDTEIDRRRGDYESNELVKDH